MKKTRKLAIRAGELRYRTGKPCKRGHFSERMTVDGSCAECRREATQYERVAFRRRVVNEN